MQEIVHNDFMTLAVDQDKHRVYYTMRGFWQTASDVPAYLEDWGKAIRLLSGKFTVLTDIRDLKLMSQEWIKIATEAQKKAVQAGLIATAELVPKNVLLKSQTGRISRESGMTKKQFADKEEAEAWLDSLLPATA